MAIIGAGAAGIGAGRELARRGVPFIILEAKQRVGGRAYSDFASLGQLWDHGCHWLHSADVNVLREAADHLKHGYVSPSSGDDVQYRSFTAGQWHSSTYDDGYPWQRLAEISVRGTVDDVAASDVLDPAHPLYPLARMWVQLMYSHDPENVSTRDAAAYRDTYLNLPVRDGYGALVARLAENLPIRLATPVTAVDLSGPDVAVTTPDGALKVKAVILAVPARTMERDRIRITPPLPHDIRQAFDDVPMGHYEKVGLSFDSLVLGEHLRPYADIFEPASSGTPVNVELHPFGRPIAVCHFAGDAVERATSGDLIAAAEHGLVAAFGAEIRKHIARRAVTRWTGDPHINGAYSCARPGRASSRTLFADAIHDKLFMCGEHTHTYFQATAHGAYETGVNQARRVAAKLGFP